MASQSFTAGYFPAVKLRSDSGVPDSPACHAPGTTIPNINLLLKIKIKRWYETALIIVYIWNCNCNELLFMDGRQRPIRFGLK
ncbi:MAG: hypothetical protein JXR70_06005 [Spirochaetales bacterium]|nr:hypothetical protein [Spirochaetales bacterium]